jgi:FtsP/CotA-like multicopper oxidase with cupredoxin domain
MTDFNILTMNGKVFPSTGPLVCKTGDKVRVRLGNLGAMDHHPIHIHGYHFRITATLCWSQSDKRAISSLSPMRLATGPSTAI